MRQRTAFLQLREQAIALRRAGRSRREISELLAITSNRTLNEALKGEPPQPWTWRPNAKDDLRARARNLREQGLAYHQIAAELGVSKSSVSLWVRDLPRPPRLSFQECRKRSAEGVRRYWAVEGPLREAQRAAVSAAAAAQIFRVYIHESADVEAAQRFWLDTTQADPAQFRRSTLKRHNPRTIRKNITESYHGCLRIDVRKSTGLYRQIEGWVGAITIASYPPGMGQDPNQT